jgi:hypothetical protein
MNLATSNLMSFSRLPLAIDFLLCRALRPK